MDWVENLIRQFRRPARADGDAEATRGCRAVMLMPPRRPGTPERWFAGSMAVSWHILLIEAGRTRPHRRAVPSFASYRRTVEVWIGILLAGIALRFPALGARWFSPVEDYFRRLSQGRGLSVFLVGATALAARLVALPILPIPQPAVHDEFSYLLAADTFAHLRVTNPPHPMWVHFETFHEIMRPTYESMYPPAQGLFLGAGQLITGDPYGGVLLSAALMCSAICWMLQGWIEPEWALLGGFLVVMRVGVFSYWANSYFGGCVASIGGALLLGALPRIKREQRPRDALLMGVGLALLATSRPYEGMVFSLPVAVGLAAWLVRRRSPPLTVLARRVLIPLTCVLMTSGILMGYYFWRGTGSPFLMPYQVNERTYDVAPKFLFQALRPEPLYHHAVMRDFYVRREVNSGYAQGRASLIWSMRSKLDTIWSFYVRYMLGLPVLLALILPPYTFCWKQISEPARFLIVVCLVMMGGLALETFALPHYVAPMTGAIFGLIVCALRKLNSWRPWARPVGPFVVRITALACFGYFLLAPILRAPTPQRYPGFPAWWPSVRVRMVQRLEALPGDQLVIVHYPPDHDAYYEWVFNAADIDHAKIVWARDMSAAANQKLIDYFKDRRVWLLEAKDGAPRLLPYEGVFVPAEPSTRTEVIPCEQPCGTR